MEQLVNRSFEAEAGSQATYQRCRDRAGECVEPRSTGMMSGEALSYLGQQEAQPQRSMYAYVVLYSRPIALLWKQG